MKKKPVEQGTAVATGGRPMKLRCDYREDDFEYWPRPTELQLAQLAARLARTEKIEPKQLVREAWALYWESCRVIKADYRKVEEYFRHEERSDASLADDCVGQIEPVPKPKKYPLTFGEAELLLLPKLKGRTADRAIVFRDYIFSKIVNRCLEGARDSEGIGVVEFTEETLRDLRDRYDDEVTKTFTQMRKRSYDAQGYAQLAGDFWGWYHGPRTYRLSEIKAANASKRWEKVREQERLAAEAKAKAEAEAKLNPVVTQPARKASKKSKSPS